MNRNRFIENVRKDLGIKDTEYAELATGAVLKTLHDRLTEGQAHNIETHLPKELKPLWSKGLSERLISLARGPQRMNKSEFLRKVQTRSYAADSRKSEDLTQSVFKALKKQLPGKAVENVGSQLPKDLKSLWTDS